MALKLPDVGALGERPIARPDGGVVGYNPAQPSSLPRQGTNLVASTLGQLGEEADQRVKEADRHTKIEQARVDELRAEEAFTALRDRQLDLTLGEKDGFMNLKGSAVVSRPTPLNKDYLERFDQESSQIERTLGSDQQRLQYKRRAAVARGQFDEHLLRHMATEGDRYAKEVYDGTVDTETRSASANWDSPLDVGLSLERVRAAVEARADKLHWPAEYATAELQKAQGRIHTAVVGQALATNNFEYAKQWADEHKGDLDPQTAKAVEKAVEDGTQKQLANGYQSDYLASEGNGPALEALRKRVLGDQALGEDRRNVLVGRIQNRQLVLEHRQELDDARRQRVIERSLNDLNGNTLAGFEPRADQFAGVLSAAKGTELEPQVRQAMALADATRSFRNQVPAVQERILAEAEAGVRADPTKFDRKVVGAWRSIYDAQRRQVQDSPISFGVEQGFLPAPAPINLADPVASAQGLNDQIGMARAMQQRYNAPLKPLTPAQVATMKTALQGASASQKSTYFAKLSQAVDTDYEGYSAIMSQLAPDDPATAVAGTYAYRGRTQASDLILRGQGILHPPSKDDGSPDKGKLWPMPPETDLRKNFQSYERDAFAGHPAARNAMYQSALAIYAAKSADEGDASGVINSSRFDESIRLATGGIEKWNGKAITLPYGYTYGQFRDGLQKRLETVVDSGRMVSEKTGKKGEFTGAGVDWTSRMLNMPLESVGDGRYVLRAGDGVLVDKDNAPVVIDFNQATPYRFAGSGPAPAPTTAEIAASERPVAGRVDAAAKRKAGQGK